MSSIFQSLREMHPYRLLLLATLAAVVLAQVAAMVMVTRSQVQKAQAFYAAEQTARVARQEAAQAAPASSRASRHGVMQVGYVATR